MVNLLLYIIICSLGVGIAFYPTLASSFASIQTNPGDSWLVNYFLEHSYQMLVNKNYIGRLWSPGFFYPYKEVLAFSENLFGAAPIYWIFRSLLSSDLAFQLWMIAVCILNFASFAVLMNRLGVTHILSALGAFLFAFSIPRIADLGFPQLLPQFFTPLVFLTLWQFIRQSTLKRLILLLLLTYLQILAGIYLGWFLLFSLLIFLCIVYLDSEVRLKFLVFWQGKQSKIIAIILLWLVVTLLTLLPYLKARLVFGARLYSEVDKMLPRLSSWFSVPPGSLWSSVLAWASKDLPMVWEHNLFAGFTVILLTIFSIYTILFKRILNIERASIVKVGLLVFISIFCLTLRIFEVSLWRIIYEILPGASVIRAVTRIWTIGYFYLFIAIIVCFDSWLKTAITKKQVRLAIASLLCLVCISEQIVLNPPSYEKAPYINQVAELCQLMKKGCDVAYLSLNPEVPFYEDQLSAMWAGIEANVPVVNGYSGNIPPNYGNNSKSLNTDQVVRLLDPVSRRYPKRLCMIFPKSLAKTNSLISTDAVQKTSNSSEKFISYTIQIPLRQVLSQNLDFFKIIKKI